MAAAQQPKHYHGPDNADHELRKAYNTVVETGVTFAWDRRPIPGVNSNEVVDIYRHAFRCHRDGDRLAAERWARTTKHLSRALWHEAKLAQGKAVDERVDHSHQGFRCDVIVDAGRKKTHLAPVGSFQEAHENLDRAAL